MKNFGCCLGIIAGLLAFSMVVQAQAAANDCTLSNYTSDNWLHPDPATQLAAVPIKGVPTTPGQKVSGASVKCDFDIFSWQWFLYLMNPASSGNGRIFEDRALFPVVDLDTCAGVAAGSTGGNSSKGLVPSILKVAEMPDIPGQAGSGDALYDRNSNIVFYNRSFTTNECGIYADGSFPDAGGTNANFPTGYNQVLELKSSWRIMGNGDDQSRYYVIQADIEGVGTKTLGLVGLHIVINTKFHPEFVWATFEHVDNAPDCTVAIRQPVATEFNRLQPANGWSFANSACNACVSANYTNGTNLKSVCQSQCNFNGVKTKPVLDSQGNVTVTGTASNICLDLQYGTPNPPPSGDDDNIPNIQLLNTLLVGPNGILTGLPSTNSMAVFKNYFLGGAVWSNVDDPNFKTKPFSATRVASTGLSNSTMESFTQFDANNFFQAGCFSCHGGANINNTAAASHLLTVEQGGAPGLIDRCNVKAGPLFSQADAEAKCPTVCANGMGWNGNWNTIASAMSVCGCNACPPAQ